MAIADILDSKKASRIRKEMESSLAYMQSATSQKEVFSFFRQYGDSYKELIDFTQKTIKVKEIKHSSDDCLF